MHHFPFRSPLKPTYRWQRRITGLILFAVTLGLIIGPAIAQLPPASAPTPIVAETAQQQFDQATRLYQAGQYAAAIAPFQQAAQTFQRQGDDLKQAAALSNLALAYQKLGDWNAAQQSLDRSLKLLQGNAQGNAREHTQERSAVLAQTLEIQGSLHLATGQPDSALDTWQQAATLYAQLQDQAGFIRAQLNQARAFQVKGFYRRALTLLENLEQQLNPEADSIAKANTLRSLGDTLQLTGDLAAAQRVLQQSLAIAQRLRSPVEISAAYLSLGNTARAAADPAAAIAFYQQAAAIAPDPLTQVQAQINHFSLLTAAQSNEANRLIQQIQTRLPNLPNSQASLFAQIHFAQRLLAVPSGTFTSNRDLATAIAATVQAAKSLGDPIAEAEALGTLGHLYEQNRQWQFAQRLTEQAILLAQNTPETTYRWQWQQGRLLNQQGDRKAAIAAYNQAIQSLQSIRTNLSAINRDVQFNFRDTVEPVYREAVALLFALQADRPNEQNLDQARRLIEALQLAELDNFFREACINGQQVVLDDLVDQKNPGTAILYPIILENQLQVIVKIPNRPLKSYGIQQSQAITQKALKQLRSQLVQPDGERAIQQLSQQVYNWLIQPIESNLAQAKVNTLVFVLDGEFRNVPMATLYDGKQYLIERYAVALSPGLQLLQPRAISQQSKFTAIAAGLTEAPPSFQNRNFSALPEIKTELDLIQQAGVKLHTLLDQAFTRERLAQAVQSLPFDIVHLATHGQFSSQAKETFILAADGAIQVSQLDALLRDRGQIRAEPIELLVLSACQTAAGDSRATLGLAGVAVRAGARSTVASLWQIGDRPTALLMGEFYRQLTTSKVTKVEALRRAQLSLLHEQFPQEDPRYRRPAFWAAYVLVGNWL